MKTHEKRDTSCPMAVTRCKSEARTRGLQAGCRQADANGWVRWASGGHLATPDAGRFRTDREQHPQVPLDGQAERVARSRG
jgi:hypothetical protein